MMKLPPAARRWLIATAMTFPLFGMGTCLTIATESTIDGFFDAWTSNAVAMLSEDLGLTTSTEEGTEATGTSS